MINNLKEVIVFRTSEPIYGRVGCPSCFTKSKKHKPGENFGF